MLLKSLFVWIFCLERCSKAHSTGVHRNQNVSLTARSWMSTEYFFDTFESNTGDCGLTLVVQWCRTWCRVDWSNFSGRGFKTLTCNSEHWIIQTSVSEVYNDWLISCVCCTTLIWNPELRTLYNVQTHIPGQMQALPRFVSANVLWDLRYFMSSL